jgi:TolB-like protein
MFASTATKPPHATHFSLKTIVMKYSSISTILLFSIAALPLLTAQPTNQLQSIAVLSIDAQGFALSPAQMANLTRLELLKLNAYNVVDRHDIDYAMQENDIDPSKCFSSTCLIAVGKKLHADKVLTGTVEVLGEKIVVSFRLIDLATQSVSKTVVEEFLNLPDQVPAMIKLTLQKMFYQQVDKDLMQNLTKQNAYESAVNVPDTDKLNLSGPRMGITVFSGNIGKLYKLEKDKGGFDASTVMFQFGYQWEVQYLNSGNFQALFEFIPIITGLDQGLFIPSCSILHGLRSNKIGLEFALGPIFSIVKMRDGRLDSRGEPTWNTGFVFGAGKSFKSGRMNFPVNIFFIPGKNGHRYGLSVGFNMVSK